MWIAHKTNYSVENILVFNSTPPIPGQPWCQVSQANYRLGTNRQFEEKVI